MFPLNVPNVLTVARILLVPVLVVALLDQTRDGDTLAAIVFAVASLTDLVDGRLARARGAITNFGKLMDPLADKLLIIAAVMALVSLHRVAAWVAMVIVAREFAVTGMRMAAAQAGIVMAAGNFGKVKTALQVLMVMLLIAVGGHHVWLTALVYVTVAATVLSGADYAFGLRGKLEQGKGGEGSSSPAQPAGSTD
jgi:CDP-diacylglycerol--glycerol-3-phosphate 3-phosphatidyltransferase